MEHKDLMDVVQSTKYPLDAFLFVQKGLDFTVRSTHGEPDPEADPASRHVSGRQLCEGLREYAVEQYGLMARSVLRRWRITSCVDFGRIVFAMVEAEFMQKTDHDTLEDFENLFDFEDAFLPTLTLVGE
jgi:uncharacterized repeat protein (TIGR04138 family)